MGTAWLTTISRGRTSLVDELASAKREIEHLQIAVEHRTVIGKAQGILMERLHIGGDAAFEYLKRLSSHENRKLYELAAEIVLDVAGATQRH